MGLLYAVTAIIPEQLRAVKILFVADIPADPNAGASGTEFQTIRVLRALGHDVIEIWSDQLPHRIKHGNLHYLIEQPRAYWQAISSQVAGQHYDVIHVNQSAAWLAAKYCHKHKLPGVFIARSHGFELRATETLNHWARKLKIPLRKFPGSVVGQLVDAGVARSCRLVAEHADGHIVSCNEDRDCLIDHFGVSADKIACIAQAAPDSYRSETQPMTGERMNRLLVVGSVKLWKGIHALTDAWNQLASANPELQLTWVCAPNEWPDASAMFAPEAKARTRFVENGTQAALMEIYDSHGIFLFPSLFEGFGKAPLEAMARGLCVVASDTGGMRDVMKSGVDGILFEAGNAARLGSVVLELCSDYDKTKKMAESARATAMQYSWNRVAHETVAFYEKLIDLKYCRAVMDDKTAI